MDNGLEISDASVVSNALVRTHLQDVLASPGFRHAGQLRALLIFLVEETLAGRAGALKEYVIGTLALGRSASFDPEHDPIVRVQARQIRARLSKYYDGEGRDSSVRIDIPKGSYAASFSAERGAVGNRLATPRRRWSVLPLRGALAVAVGIAVGVSAWALWGAPGWPGERDPGGPRTSSVPVAVLPFVNLNGVAAEDYFSDGLTEELILVLSRFADLNVIARTSAFSFKGKNVDLSSVGRDLGVTHVVEGSVRREGSRVRIGVRLLRVADKASLWTETYDRNLTDALSAQREIATRIAAVLSVRMTAELGASSGMTPSSEAQDLYLRGRHLWNRRSAEALALARGLFEQAITRAPEFAEAHAALAATYAVMDFNGVTPPGQTVPAARAAAERALSLDARSTLALAVLAGIASGSDHDWDRSNRLFQQAIALQPSDATVHHWYGTNLVDLRRFEEGIAELQRAQQLDPLSMPIAYSLGEAYLYARRFDRVLEQANAMTLADPTYSATHDLRARAHAMLGNVDEALRAAERCTLTTLYRALVLAIAGRHDEARTLVVQAAGTDLATKSPYAIAAVYAQIGDADEAFAWTNRAVAARQPELVVVNVDPSFDPVRKDPRFAALVRSLELGSPWLIARAR